MEHRGQQHGSKTPPGMVFLEKLYDGLEKTPKYISHYEKCSNTGLFLVCMFLLFNPNTGKYGPEITPNFDTFHAVIMKG